MGNTRRKAGDAFVEGPALELTKSPCNVEGAIERLTCGRGDGEAAAADNIIGGRFQRGRLLFPSRPEAVEVRVVVNGAEAQSYIEGRGSYSDREYYPLPDVIVCDFKMPQKTGAEFLQWLRARPEFSEVPFVIYSGSVLKKEEEMAVQLGATLYLRKAADFALTIERVEKILALLPKK